MSTPVNCIDSALPMPVCENAIPPVKVYDKTGCCFHYECQCEIILFFFLVPPGFFSNSCTFNKYSTASPNPEIPNVSLEK